MRSNYFAPFPWQEIPLVGYLIASPCRLNVFAGIGSVVAQHQNALQAAFMPDLHRRDAKENRSVTNMRSTSSILYSSSNFISALIVYIAF